jgi:hypothetical protein
VPELPDWQAQEMLARRLPLLPRRKEVMGIYLFQGIPGWIDAVLGAFALGAMTCCMEDEIRKYLDGGEAGV